MTNEEAIKYLNEFILFKKISNITEEEAVECFKLAVEALQKQPCKLLILKANFSLRQAELKEWSERIKRANEEGLIILPSYFEPILVPNDVEIRIEQEPKTEGARGDIPLQQTVPEMPQQKIGHWTHDGGYWKNRWICSECGYKLYDEQSKYCPNCGSKNGGTGMNELTKVKQRILERIETYIGDIEFAEEQELTEDEKTIFKSVKNIILEEFDRVTPSNTEHIIKSTIKEYIGKEYDDVTELLLALNKDLCERIRKGE